MAISSVSLKHLDEADAAAITDKVTSAVERRLLERREPRDGSKGGWKLLTVEF